MTLARPQRTRLLQLVRSHDSGAMTTEGERELRDLVRLEGYPDYAKEMPLEGLVNLGQGILGAYIIVDGIDVTAEAA